MMVTEIYAILTELKQAGRAILSTFFYGPTMRGASSVLFCSTLFSFCSIISGV
jgi:hypothetical protein